MEKKEKAPVLRFKDTNGKDYPAWEQRKLTDLVSFYGGLTYKPTDVKSKGVLVLRSSNVKDGALIAADNVYVDPEVATSEKVKIGDIVMVVRNGSKALIGKHAEVKQPMPDTVVGAFMVGLRSPCPSFANALLNTSDFDKEIAKNMGATINQLTGYMFKQMVFFMPGKEEQGKIGVLFSTLENTITLHQRKLEALKKLKRTLLQKMFPKQGQLNPELRFPGFTNDWEQRKLEDCATIIMGQSPKSENYTNDPKDHILVQGNADLKNGQVVPRVWTTEVTKVGKVGDIILSVRAPVGEVGKTAFDVVIGRGVAAIRGNDFLLQTLQKLKEFKYWGKVSAGSTFDSITSEILKSTVISMPTIEEQIKIGEFLSSVDNLITLHQRKLETYKKLKKGLLQKMFI